MCHGMKCRQILFLSELLSYNVLTLGIKEGLDGWRVALPIKSF